MISGLSWAGLWGAKSVQAGSTFPAEKWDAVPLSDATHASMNHGAAMEAPWNLEQTSLPESGLLAGVQAITGPVTVVILRAVSGMVLWLKRRPAGAWLGAPPRPVDIPYAKGALLVTQALAFPMLGLVLLGVIALDLVVLAAVPPLKRLVS